MCRRLITLVWACIFLLAGCNEPQPVRIGLIAGLSDRGSDFGESVRNGVILAVEEQNAAGGINGRPIELIVRDDGQDKAQAIKAAQELIALRPELIIGPVTSSMATAIVPLMNQAGVVMISPTVASTNFLSQDDNFFRVNCTTREAAIQHARVLFQRGIRHPALAYDASNLPFSGTWTDAFVEEFSRQGGSISASFGFPSSGSTRFSSVVSEVLSHRPDALVFVASTLDTARLAHQARRLAPHLPLSSSEWAASGEALSEMGGKAVNGLLMTHAYDRTDTRAPYSRFRAAFKQRFQREFGSFSLLAYDTAHVVFVALTKRHGDESVKSALLKNGPYLGVQQEIRFDAFGDATRQVYFTEIRNGNFVQIQ